MKTKYISVRVSDEFKQIVEEFRKAKKWSITTTVVEALRRLMEAERKGDKHVD